MALFSFLTARELVSKSHDGVSFKNSTLKARVTSTSPRVTRTGRILPATVAHLQCASHLYGKFSFLRIFSFVLIFPKIAFRSDIRPQNDLPCCYNFVHATGASGSLIGMRAWSSRNCMTLQTCKRRKHALIFLAFAPVKFCESLYTSWYRCLLHNITS